MSSYTSLSKAYGHPYGLYIGGLGESVIEQELCFCVDKEKFPLIDKKDIIKKSNTRGFCFQKNKCKKCVKILKEICNFNK